MYNISDENYIDYSNTTKNNILFIDVSACQQHESRWGELPVEPRMGQAFTYWRPAPEVSPDEGFQREATTSINSMLFLVKLE